MPIYEYKCENGHSFDEMQRMADDPLRKCVECGAPAVRVLTAPAIHFKGGGFYNTDYGKRNKGNGNGAPESGSDSKSGSGDSGSGGSSDSGSDSGSKSESKSSDSKSTASSGSSSGSSGGSSSSD